MEGILYLMDTTLGSVLFISAQVKLVWMNHDESDALNLSGIQIYPET